MQCLYYQAEVLTKKAWFVSGCFRNEDHLAFVRALNGSSSIFEFFVPRDQKEPFLKLIQMLEAKGVLSCFEEKPNRIMKMLDQ